MSPPLRRFEAFEKASHIPRDIVLAPPRPEHAIEIPPLGCLWERSQHVEIENREVRLLAERRDNRCRHVGRGRLVAEKAAIERSDQILPVGDVLDGMRRRFDRMLGDSENVLGRPGLREVTGVADLHVATAVVPDAP